MKSSLLLGNALKIATLALLFVSKLTFAAPLPIQATAVIEQINNAAKAADFASLQLLMTQDFIWSFGGDASASQAIAEWKTRPDALAQLIQVTSQPCVLHPDNTVECPRNAGLGYRAGFRLTNAGWRMHFFVQGD